MTIALAEMEMYGPLSGSWVDASTAPGVCTVIDGQLWMDSDGVGDAVLQQIVNIQQGGLHVLKFTIVNGPLNLRIGLTQHGTDILEKKKLGTGVHLIEFTPWEVAAVGYIYVEFWHRDNAGRVIDDISILPGPTFRLPIPYAETDLDKIHYLQISDVLYLACSGHEPRRLERRGHRSWSLTKHRPNDGPFQNINTTDTTIKASATSGEVTLTASTDTFTTDSVGMLVKFSGAGQHVAKTAAVGDTYTQGIKVTGINSSERTFSFLIVGTFVASVRVQRSSGNENNYIDYLGPYTTPVQGTHYDAQDNQTYYYRLAVKAGEYTSGTVQMSLDFAGGSTTGIARVIGYRSKREVRAECLTNLPGTAPVKSWYLGSWNATDGWPVTLTSGYGRLWWGRGTRVWSSKSDDFTSHAEGTEADQAISARLGVRSPEAVRWLGFTRHLVIGTRTGEFLGVPASANEAVSPTNFQVLPSSQEGGADLMPVTAPGSVIFPHRTLKKIIQFVQDPKAISETAYTAVDLNRLSPDLLWDGIVRIAIQDEPERRIYVVLNSGICQVLLFRREEDVVAWGTIETDGFIEDVSIVPQSGNDEVTFIVRRVVNDADVRMLERFGEELVLNDEDYYHLDCAVAYSLTRPEAKLQLDETMTSPRTFNCVADADAFAPADVGKKLWVHVDEATLCMTVTGYTGVRQVTAVVDWAVNTDDFDEAASVDRVAPARRWGLNAAATTFGGLDHLEGRTVRLFGDMKDLGTDVVNAGTVTLPEAASVARVGLPYRSRWKSLKLSYGAQKGTALTMPKAIKSVAFLLFRTGATLTYGFSFGKLRPLRRRDAEVPYAAPVPLYSGEQFEGFDAQYRKDSRIVLEIDGPHPATVAGYVPTLSEHDR